METLTRDRGGGAWERSGVAWRRLPTGRVPFGAVPLDGPAATDGAGR